MHPTSHLAKVLALIALFSAFVAFSVNAHATEIVIQRLKTGSKATIGTISVDGVRICEYLEFPTHAPFKFLSGGDYLAFTRADGQVGWRIEIKNTTPFTNIQIHAGNSLPQTQGCFLAGFYADAEKPWVEKSKDAMAALRKAVDGGHGELSVKILNPLGL